MFCIQGSSVCCSLELKKKCLTLLVDIAMRGMAEEPGMRAISEPLKEGSVKDLLHTLNFLCLLVQLQ